VGSATEKKQTTSVFHIAALRTAKSC